MDLRRHIAVIWRFNWLIAAGIALGVALAMLATFSVSFSGGLSLEYRTPVLYSSKSLTYVTQPGFLEGRILPVIPDDAAKMGSEQVLPNEDRFASLATLYSFLLTSRELQQLIGDLPEGAEILPASLSSGSGSRRSPLPLLEIETRATTPQDAQRLNNGALGALRTFVVSRQEENNIAQKDRVRLNVVTPPKPAEVAEGRPYTGAVVLFLLTVLLSIGIAYVWENLSPATGRRDGSDPYENPRSYPPPPADLEPDDMPRGRDRGPQPDDNWWPATAPERPRIVRR